MKQLFQLVQGGLELPDDLSWAAHFSALQFNSQDFEFTHRELKEYEEVAPPFALPTRELIEVDYKSLFAASKTNVAAVLTRFRADSSGMSFLNVFLELDETQSP